MINKENDLIKNYDDKSDFNEYSVLQVPHSKQILKLDDKEINHEYFPIFKKII